MFLLDGVVDLGSFIGNYNYQPIVDDIQEFKCSRTTILPSLVR